RGFGIGGISVNALDGQVNPVQGMRG
ncbi:MAG: hypothetical protein QOI83_2479, partial [Streptomycetaceae bacterium]|nr:hypothetical protein [Streptomycetaceae bacterium]